jgi:hypothetical protein
MKAGIAVETEVNLLRNGTQIPVSAATDIKKGFKECILLFLFSLSFIKESINKGIDVTRNRVLIREFGL